MSIFTQFVEARSLSEALLIQSEIESPIGQAVASKKADEAFLRLAELRGFRVEKITADPARTLAYLDAGRPMREAAE